LIICGNFRIETKGTGDMIYSQSDALSATPESPPAAREWVLSIRFVEGNVLRARIGIAAPMCTLNPFR